MTDSLISYFWTVHDEKIELHIHDDAYMTCTLYPDGDTIWRPITPERAAQHYELAGRGPGGHVIGELVKLPS